MRVLVFGGNGQLGYELSRMAAARGVPLAALPRQRADVADADQVRSALREYSPSLVVNAAAFTRVDDAEDDEALAARTNATGAGVVARACAAAGVPLVHISTDYVFDGTKPGPYVETDSVAPLGAYGRTKAAGEAAVPAASDRHVILRTAWLYGEFGSNFLKTILRLARERDVLRVVDDQRGCPTSTRDLAQAILRIGPRLEAGDPVWGTYHFAGDGTTTWYGLTVRAIERLAAATGRAPKVEPIATTDYPTRARRPQNSALDCARFEAAFGFRGRAWEPEADEIADLLIQAG